MRFIYVYAVLLRKFRLVKFPTSKRKGEHIALLLSICLSVSRSTKFPFIFFPSIFIFRSEVALNQMKFGMQIYQNI